MGRFHGPCEYFFCELPMSSLLFYAFKTIRCPFSLNLHCNVYASPLQHFKFFWWFLSFDLQKFNNEEWVDMPTCNLTETTHNILLQQLGNHDICLYTMAFNNYVWALKQSTLYRQYSWRGPSGHGLDRNEFLLGGPKDLVILLN